MFVGISTLLWREKVKNSLSIFGNSHYANSIMLSTRGGARVVKMFMSVCLGTAAVVFCLAATMATAQTDGCVLLMDGFRVANPGYDYEWYAGLVYHNGHWEVALRFVYHTDPEPQCECSWAVNIPAPRQGEDWYLINLRADTAIMTYLYYSDGKVYRTAGGAFECGVCVPPTGWELIYDMGYTGACQTFGWPIRGSDSLTAVGDNQIPSGGVSSWLASQPNPFSSTTEVKFHLESPDHAKVEIYDPTGRRIRTLLDSDISAGDLSVFWDGRNESGQQAASGVYFCRIITSRGPGVQKIIRLR